MSVSARSLGTFGLELGKRRKPLTRATRVWIQHGLLLVLYALIFSFWQLDPVPWNVHCASILLFAVCLVPITVWRAQGSQGPPMFELICLAYAVQFAFPVYLQPNEMIVKDAQHYLSWEGVLKALLLTTLGVSSMIAGYFVTLRLGIATKLARIDLQFQPRKLVTYIYFAISIGLSLALLQSLGRAPDNSGSFGAIVRVLTNQLNLAIILLAYQRYRDGNRQQKNALLLYGLTGLTLLLGLSSGMLESALIPLALIFIVRWHSTRKIAWRWLLAGVVLFVVLNPVKVEYREQAWFSGDVGLAKRITLWFGLASQNLTGELQTGKVDEDGGFVQQATSRLDLLHRFVFVEQMTPGTVPFYGGATYEYLSYGWIPRIIWPEKPSASEAAQMIDVDYGFLYEQQSKTASIGIGQLPEAWVNFGAVGVIVVLMLQGIFFAILKGMFCGPRSEGGQAIYLSVMVLFLNGIGSVVVVFFTSLFQTTVANALVLRLFSTGFRAKRQRRVVSNLVKQPVSLR